MNTTPAQAAVLGGDVYEVNLAPRMAQGAK
jgi:hypothetical protein